MKIGSILPLYRKKGDKVLPAYLEIDLEEGDLSFGIGEVREKPGAIYLPVSPFVTALAIQEFFDDYFIQKLPENLPEEVKGFLHGAPILTEAGKKMVEEVLTRLERMEKGLVLKANEEILRRVEEAGIEASFILIPLKEGEADE